MEFDITGMEAMEETEEFPGSLHLKMGVCVNEAQKAAMENALIIEKKKSSRQFYKLSLPL